MTSRASASEADDRSWTRSASVVTVVAVGLIAILAAGGIGGAVDPGSFAFAAGSDQPGDRTHHDATARLADPSEHDGNWLDQLTL